MKNVGTKIRTVRETNNLTIEEVANRAGMNIEQVIAIEESGIIPSLSPLIKIARAIGVRLGTFLDDNEAIGPIVCRRGENLGTMRLTNNSTQQKDNMAYQSLSTKAGRHMEPFIIDVDPQGDNEFIPSSHEGEEFIYVLGGKIEINYGNDIYTLEAGDSIYYDSIIDHHVHGLNEPAQILAVVYAPF